MTWDHAVKLVDAMIWPVVIILLLGALKRPQRERLGPPLQ
jgi:hypothetical protein